MAVGDKTPKQSPVKVFQFASNFVGYNNFASVLRVKDVHCPVTLCTSRLKFLSVFHFENTVNFSMDSTAKFPDIHFSISPRKIVQISCKPSHSRENLLHFEYVSE